jgi:hypothetical protein
MTDTDTPEPGTRGGRPLDRIEIEIRLNEDRAWLLRTLSAMSDEERTRGLTHSQDDPDGPMWSFADHFIHTSLIEQNWNTMFRRHIAGKAGMPSRVREDGQPQTREEVMAGIHAWTEEWAQRHRGKPLSELARIGLEIRADTLKLLSELTDEDLVSEIPGTPWADSTVGGIMAANAGHGRTHFKWAKDGLAALEG